MNVKPLALTFVLSAVASPSSAGDETGRYTMSTAGDSIWRLDTAIGAMSVCGRKLDHWACESVADDSLALKQEVDRLKDENQELKDKLAKADEREAEAAPGQGSEPHNPYARFPDQAIDEMTDFVNKMIRRLQDLVRDLKQQQTGKEL